MKDFVRVAKAIFHFYRYLLGVPFVLGLVASAVMMDARILAITAIALAALAVIPWVLLGALCLLGLALTCLSGALQRFGMIFGVNLKEDLQNPPQLGTNAETALARARSHRRFRYKMYYRDSGRIIH